MAASQMSDVLLIEMSIERVYNKKVIEFIL